MRGTLMLVALAGCGGKDDGTTPVDSAEPHTTPEPPIEFMTAIETRSITGSLDKDLVEAHQMSGALLAAIGVVASDSEVQNRLSQDNGTNFRGMQPICWQRPSPAQSSFLMNFDGCSQFGMSGGVYVNDHPSGPVLLEFLNFTVGGRIVQGIVALDKIPEIPFAWSMYETDTLSPGTDNRVPVGIEVGGVEKFLAYDGGGVLSLGTSSQFSMWGIATLEGFTTTGGVTTTTVLHGADSEEEIDPTVPLGLTALKLPLNWLECRCPTGGNAYYDVLYTVDTLTFDLDDLKAEDDGVDEPDVFVEVSYPVTGQARVIPNGCGTYEVQYDDAVAVAHVIEGQQLVSLIQQQCDNAAIPDPEHCERLKEAATTVGEVQVTVPKAALDDAVIQTLGSQLDSSFCQI